MLLDRGNDHLSPRAEALLYAADRAQHAAEIMNPSLSRGAVVITDRYIDSTLAYQGGGRSLSTAELARLSRWATGNLVPDLTVLLDVDPRIGLARTTGGGDRIELEALQFHQRVRESFLELAARAPSRYLVVDAGLPADEVHALVRARLQPLVDDLAARVGVRHPPVATPTPTP
jgi:dTMP kinase